MTYVPMFCCGFTDTAKQHYELTSPRDELVLLELLHLRVWVLVVHLEDPDEVGDGEHADEPLLRRVPQRRRPHAVVDEREEGLLDEQLRVEDDELGRRGDEIVALVVPEELDEYLALVAL